MSEQNTPEWTNQEWEAAAQRGRELHESEPRIAEANYDAATGLLSLQLAGGAVEGARLSFLPRAFPGLESASDAQLSAFIVGGQGASIRWPELNVGIGTLGLVRWMTGPRDETMLRPMANLARMRAKTLTKKQEPASA